MVYKADGDDVRQVTERSRVRLPVVSLSCNDFGRVAHGHACVAK